MNKEIIKEHLISAAQTFIATFIFAAATAITSEAAIEFTSVFWVGIVLTAIRAALKETVARFAPKFLGGRK